MSGCRIYLFVDTNLLIQCRPLGELDWSPWDSFEEVQLIVSRPVLREIDYRKNKGNDRVGNRARAVAAMFRKMINAGQKVVHTSSPRVILSVEPQHSYAKELKDLLNYQERDDQLIGTVYEFKQCNQDKDVRLLTHDTNPLFTAKGVALKADMIPDNWLLPPENTETERKLAVLKAENALLKRAEPSFAIWCVDASGTETERYEDSYAWFEPLSDAQVDELMQRLKNCFPMQDDFGSRVQAERAAAHTAIETIMGIKQVFTPATDEEIAQYRDEAYPQWLERCEYVLRNHHRALQRKTPILKFTFLSQNRGTRPATDALVTIEAEGNFNVTPPLHDGQDEEQNDEDISLAKEQATGLARPPVAPCGQWRTAIGGRSYDLRGAVPELDPFLRGLWGITHNADEIVGHPFPRTPIIHSNSHDPNAFYFKPNRPNTPQGSFCLECDQWRHNDRAEDFLGEIHVPSDQDEVKGALVCRIQAGNLSKSASKRIPVRIEMTHVSAFGSARKLVDTLAGTPNHRIEPGSVQPGRTG